VFVPTALVVTERDSVTLIRHSDDARAGRSEVRFPAAVHIFLSSKRPDWPKATQLHTQWVPGGNLPEAKRSGRQADH
jgi:hypothetical protein